jgi:hypothetical protein
MRLFHNANVAIASARPRQAAAQVVATPVS